VPAAGRVGEQQGHAAGAAHVHRFLGEGDRRGDQQRSIWAPERARRPASGVPSRAMVANSQVR
jgi:hypothetical protein